jgi:hypothetical protein
MPEIRADRGSLTFRLEIAGVDMGARLIIRCDSDGTVWASTEGDATDCGISPPV